MWGRVQERKGKGERADNPVLASGKKAGTCYAGVLTNYILIKARGGGPRV